VAASLKVERVKYKTANNGSPGEEAKAFDEAADKGAFTGVDLKTKEALRPKAVRRAGAPGQADRTRQPPNHR
jgi:hypothetical protein